MDDKSNEYNSAFEEERRDGPQIITEDQYKETPYVTTNESDIGEGGVRMAKVVESRALSGIARPFATGDYSIPEHVLLRLSPAQIQAFQLAVARFKKTVTNNKRTERAGFLLGDGAGLGKGRTNIAIIHEFWRQGHKKHLYISMSQELNHDCKRDIDDLLEDCEPADCLALAPKFISQFYEAPNALKNITGLIFMPYSHFRLETVCYPQREKRPKGHHKIYHDICLYLGDSTFQGVIIFDESHTGKNALHALKGRRSKLGKFVLKLQKRYPDARVVYSTATAASLPSHFGIMTRLGLWGPTAHYKNYKTFMKTLEDYRSLSAFDVLCLQLKQEGALISRQLCYDGIKFIIKDVAMSKADKTRMDSLYDEYAALWRNLWKDIEKICDFYKSDMDKEVSKLKKTAFWSAHQMFFRMLIVHQKLDTVIRLTRNALETNYAVVIGLQGTGESAYESDCNYESMVSPTRTLLEKVINTHVSVVHSQQIRKKKVLAIEDIDSESDTEFMGVSDDEVEQNGEADNEFSEVYETQPRLSTNGATIEISSKELSKRRSMKAVTNCFEPLTSEPRKKALVSDSPKSNGRSVVQNKAFEEHDLCASASSSDDEEWERDSLLGTDDEFQYDADQLTLENTRGKSQPRIEESELTFSRRHGSAEFDSILELKETYLKKLDELENPLPLNFLDELLENLRSLNIKGIGSMRDRVAELTGRKLKALPKDDEEEEGAAEENSKFHPFRTATYQAEKDSFMNNAKDVIIISEAASTGISLHADPNCRNQRRRIHITVEFSWSADRILQQLGRTHRANEVCLPRYYYVASRVPAERRFISVPTQRIKALGAITNAERRNMVSIAFRGFDCDNYVGQVAIRETLCFLQGDSSTSLPPSLAKSDIDVKKVRDEFYALGLLKDESDTKQKKINLSKFLFKKVFNRLLGCSVSSQLYFITLFMGFFRMHEKVQPLDRSGVLVQKPQVKLTLIGSKTYSTSRGSKSGSSFVEIRQVVVTHGTFVDEVQKMWNERKPDDYLSGIFYEKDPTVISKRIFYVRNICVNTGCSTEVLMGFKPKHEMFNGTVAEVYEPHTKYRDMTIDDLVEFCKTHDRDVVEPRTLSRWRLQQEQLVNNCLHWFSYGLCKEKGVCVVGRSAAVRYLIVGDLLTCWKEITDTLAKSDIVIVVANLKHSEEKFFGIQIPKSLIGNLKAQLGKIGTAPMEIDDGKANAEESEVDDMDFDDSE